jgi:hypothetical protein
MLRLMRDAGCLERRESRGQMPEIWTLESLGVKYHSVCLRWHINGRISPFLDGGLLISFLGTSGAGWKKPSQADLSRARQDLRKKLG